MARSVEVPVEEVLRVFRFLEKAQSLLHQPLRYRDPVEVERFAVENYDELKDLYYRVVWDWLPEDCRAEVEAE